MEKYYGFRVDIDGELDPIHIEAMKDIAGKIMSAYDFNPNEYFVYFHQLSIKPKDKHFCLDGGLSKRLKQLSISFSVNQKQRRTRRIKLFNFLLDKTPEDQVKWTGGADEVTFYLEGKYIAENLGFRNEIVTFISKKVRKDHRKIKVSVEAYPTEEYQECFKNQKDSYLTQLDFRFEKPISLRMPENWPIKNGQEELFPKQHESGVTVLGDVYNVYGPSSGVGKNASGENSTNQQIVISHDDLKELRNQLDLLRSEMRSSSKSTSDGVAVAEIGKAIDAVDNGDTPAILVHLKNAGHKALEIAEKISISLVTALMKQELGI